MADEGPPVPPLIQLVPPVKQPVVPSVQPVVPAACQVQQAVPEAGNVPLLSWSHFKPEFSNKSNEDAEPNLSRTNDYIDRHAFPGTVKTLHFCLDYDMSLTPITVD